MNIDHIPYDLLFFTGIICIFLSCQKDDENIGPEDLPLGKFTMEATLNDTAHWEANKVYGIKDADKDSINMSMGNLLYKGCYEEVISFNNIPITIDTIPLEYVQRGFVRYTKQPTANYTAMDCDAIGEQYDLLDSAVNDNFIKINEIIENNTGTIKRLKGTFQMTLLFDSTRSKLIFPNQPDTLRLTDGTFNARILKGN